MIVDIVTGATQGIGKAVAEFIALQRASTRNENHALVLVGRSETRGLQARDDVRHLADGKAAFRVLFESCDLSDWQSVQALPRKIEDQLKEPFQVGVLVNNAAECPVRQEWVQIPQRHDNGSVSTVSVDRQFASNVLGYHFMIKAFEPYYHNEDGITQSHIVNVASTWAGGLDLHDVHFKRRGYDNDDAYRQSKQCNRMQTKYWSQCLQGKALVNACHPGDPCTTLSKALGYNLYAGPPTWKQIANHSPFPVVCGLDPNNSLGNATGRWFVGRQPTRCSYERMDREAQALHDLCDSFCV